MKTRNAFALSILLCLALLSSCSGGKKIVIATDATWPPMEFVDDSKNIVGFDIDLIKEVAKAGGFEIEIKNVNWDGIFGGLDAGQYDAVISSVTITEERKASMDFSDPYINAGQVLIVRADAPDSVAAIIDLAGKELGAQIGTTGALEIEKVKEVKLRTYDELGLAVADLANGRVEGVVADTPIAAQFVLQNDAYKDKLKIVGEPFTEEVYGIAVKKGNAKLLSKINSGLTKTLDSGKAAELETTWLR